MINSFTYDDNFVRTIPACIIDGRSVNPAVAGQIGDVIQAFCNNEVLKAMPINVLTYKLETDNGNLMGAMTLRVVNGIASLFQLWLRAAYLGNITEITGEIGTFITERDWVFDQLI